MKNTTVKTGCMGLCGETFSWDAMQDMGPLYPPDFHPREALRMTAFSGGHLCVACAQSVNGLLAAGWYTVAGIVGDEPFSEEIKAGSPAEADALVRARHQPHAGKLRLAIAAVYRGRIKAVTP